jgi:hypothetical protein
MASPPRRGGEVAVFDHATPTVRFGRLEQRGLLLGLSAAQVALVGTAVLLVAMTGYAAGAPGVLVSLPLWASLLMLALVPVQGRPMVEWLPVAGWWLARRTGGTTRQCTPLGTTDSELLVVPGAAALTLTRGPGTDAGLVCDRRDDTITAVLAVHGCGFLLADPGAQAQQITGWGNLLGSLCQQPSIVRVQVLDRTVSGGSAPVQRWWATHAQDRSTWAVRVVADLVADTGRESVRHETLLAVAVRPRHMRRGIPTVESLTEVERHLATVEQAAITAGLRADGWISADRLVGLLRASFDPYSAAAHHDLPSAALPGVAGMAMEEQWDHVRTDSAVHAVYWVREWPRSEVHPGFLQPLLLAHGTRRALSITAEPLPVARALRDIRRAKVEHAADAAQRARMGRLEDEATRAEAAELLRREQQLVAGHGDLRFAGLLTVTAASVDELHGECAAVESAAAQAMCELRRLVGQQAAAFVAAALPLARGVS